jgi:hypothetical protein
MRSRISKVVITFVITLVVLAGHQQAKPQSNSGYNGFDLVDEMGNIRKPADRRDRYEALGTYAVVRVSKRLGKQIISATSRTAVGGRPS